MKIVILFALLSSIIVGCGISESQRKFLQGEPVRATDKELTYIDSLQSSGFSDVKLFVPDIGHGVYGQSQYNIEMYCPFNLTLENQDSIIKISDKIADELYSKTMEDSIIYDCNEIFVQFSVAKSEIDKDLKILWQHYSKPSLERWNGFKVIKIGKNKFKRVPISQKK